LVCLILLMLAAQGSGGVEDGVPQPFSATYVLQRGLFNVAQTRVELQRPGAGRYVYRTHSYATGIAALLGGGGIRERSEGTVTEDGLRPTRYRYRRSGDETRDGELRFYWDDGQVVNDFGDHPWRMDIPPDTKDRVIGTVQLMYDLAAGRDSLEYPVADGGRLRTYRFEVDGEETLNTDLGRFETLRVIRTDAENRSRTILWCAKALHYLPVRIDHTDAGEDDYRMELEKVKGLQGNPE
jgi:hypothetical protein